MNAAAIWVSLTEAAPPSPGTQIDGQTLELWDADDFAPWVALRWQTVRVLRYRQDKPEGTA